MAGGGGGRGSTNLSVLLQTQRAPPSSEPFDPLFLPAPASSFLGTTSMLSFEHVRRPNSNRSLFTTFEQEVNGEDDDFDEYFLQPEKKKKRLTVEQVQFLEKSFEVENKLEPERKIQLAKDLGLQPRQVAIWFQNRRARWKTKRLEKDYDTLQASFNGLKADYDNLLKENDKLKQEVLQLADKLAVKGKVKQEEPPPQKPVEMVSCSKSDMFDSVSDSPHYTDGVQSFEPDQSEVTQDEEEDELSKTLSDPAPYMFPKLEDNDYSDPPASSCSFEFHVEDQAFWSSAY
ncbi:hypothetical protein HRI_001330700 [Hibiscus trionum]|uniref:Homeobox-leucine zipper protein n=1 Tax=Hibiscus trionum TaxID=183268 RepID=A0A9W7HFP9_HIBTR|nr:hypothetical protein HRI_001330700 [Hibiscus trionum]